MGILYSVALPIGNLNDITLRALEILKSADCIACEDTRNTKILLDKYKIDSFLIDCHKFNEKERSRKFSDILNENKTIALVSDAGTPGICDPGSALFKELLKKGHKIVPVPGACAVAAFLSAVPRENELFAFAGFLPKSKTQKEDVFKKFSFVNCVFYDSPNRLQESLEDIKQYFGEDKKIAIGRELTKIHEEIIISSVKEMIEYYQSHTLKGEIVGMIFADNEKSFEEENIKNDIKLLKKENFSGKDIAKILSLLKGYPKNTVYQLSLKTD